MGKLFDSLALATGFVMTSILLAAAVGIPILLVVLVAIS